MFAVLLQSVNKVSIGNKLYDRKANVYHHIKDDMILDKAIINQAATFN